MFVCGLFDDRVNIRGPVCGTLLLPLRYAMSYCIRAPPLIAPRAHSRSRGWFFFWVVCVFCHLFGEPSRFSLSGHNAKTLHRLQYRRRLWDIPPGERTGHYHNFIVILINMPRVCINNNRTTGACAQYRNVAPLWWVLMKTQISFSFFFFPVFTPLARSSSNTNAMYAIDAVCVGVLCVDE